MDMLERPGEKISRMTFAEISGDGTYIGWLNCPPPIYLNNMRPPVVLDDGTICSLWSDIDAYILLVSYKDGQWGIKPGRGAKWLASHNGKLYTYKSGRKSVHITHVVDLF